MSERRAPAECANCGTALSPRARVCPECGADERTGWRETDDTRYDGLDLPDSAFDDESSSDSTAKRRPLRTGLAWYWYVAAALVLVSLVLGVVGLR